LGINPDGTVQPPPVTPEQDIYDDDSSMMDSETSAAFEPFKDLCKRRFLWYYDTYLASIKVESGKVTDGAQFTKMPFEHAGNTMEGKFLYSELERRLKFVRARLDHETASWAAEGLILQDKESGVAANLQRQFEQTVEHYKKQDSVTIDVELVDENPFLWRVVRLILLPRMMIDADGSTGLLWEADDQPGRRTFYYTPRF